ncbi:cupin domain-containing protein [Pseudoflavonifractor intestinihominis]|uniref:Cupin domain-containing protein n=1 Tax=Pseudoflavonifractor intestinihominis TaxID=3133171 RepID=A0ABV1E5A9_9FIRM|nr:cupin domain-containing protein [uncultured Pseudoflavonifractor sp.]
MDALRNLPTQQPEQLAQLIQIQPGRVVSMSMSRQENCQMTLLAFGDGESVSEERYFGDTLYYVLEGELHLVLEGVSRRLCAGDCLAVPAGEPHEVAAPGGCKLLQITLS